MATARRVWLLTHCGSQRVTFQKTTVPFEPTAQPLEPTLSVVTPYSVELNPVVFQMLQVPLYLRIIGLLFAPPTAQPLSEVVITTELRLTEVLLATVDHRVPSQRMMTPPSPTAQASEFKREALLTAVVLLTMVTEFRFELVGLTVLSPVIS